MATYLPGFNFPIYSGWTQYTPVIPKLYWDVYSAEQRMKQLCMQFDKVESYLDYIADTLNEWDIEFTEAIEEEFAKLWHAVDNGLENAVHDWITENIAYIFDNVVQQVYFGITDDGYFCAYVPDSWNDIIFDTGMVYGQFDYGRLILRFDVDNARGVIDNTGRYDDSSTDGIIASINGLERRVRTNETTLYTNLSE